MSTSGQVDKTPHGIWAATLEQLVTYSYLGCHSVLGEGYNAVGEMVLRSDMRHGGGLTGAPAAIAMLDAAGNAIDRHWQLALTHIDVHLGRPASDVRRLGIIGSMTHSARSQKFTECMFTDADNPDSVVGLGTADWTVMSDTLPGFVYVDPGPGVEDTGDLPPLSSAYGAVPRDGGGFVIPEMTLALGYKALHHGPILVNLEAAALQVAGPNCRVETFSARIVKGGKQGPFTATATVLSDVDDVIMVRADLADDGAGHLVATAVERLRRFSG
ncbi:PaaI family thioesterase [Mycobacterium sp.]|uniref:PaaI family thioesterase n=1 Tax=Mycobacterium sp. TaxID=1785 RepID=UPI003D1083DE